MFLPGRHIPLAFIFLAVYVGTTTVAYPHPEDDKTFNLKIGFDLTHGENGAPALRIRDFEDSKEFNPRAAEDDDVKKAPEDKPEGGDKEKDDSKKALRAGSLSSSGSSSGEGQLRKKKDGSNSNESAPKKKSKPKEVASDDSGSGDSEADAKRSTRGLGDVEPDDIFKQKPVGRENNDDDDDRRRRKRSVEIRRLHKRAAEKYIEHYYENIKRKHKKAHNIPLIPRSTSYKPY